MSVLFIAYLLNIIDYLFTAHWVRLYGLSVEANPFGRWLFENNTAFTCKFILVPILLALLGVYISKHPQAKWVAYIPIIVYGLIVCYHLAIFFYTKKIL